MPYHYDDTAIADLFLGRSIVATDMEASTLTLSDGTVLTVEPNEGGCICGAGDYFLSSLSTTDNIITNVEVVDTPLDEYEEAHRYNIFVYCDNTQINAVEIEGDDGNGYYGTGFWIGIAGSPHF